MGGDDENGSSITDQALTEFNRPEFAIPNTHNLPMGPVFIRNFSLKKDSKAANSADAGGGLQTAPNFASAILSRWVAEKLGLSNAPSGENNNASPSSSSSSAQHVFRNVNAVVRPGEGTLLLGPSSSGKTTFMRSLGDVLSGISLENTEGTVSLGPTRWDPTKCPSNLKRTVAYVDQSDLTLTPILTVEETVRFARSCAEELDPVVLEESMEAIFKLAGLHHVRQTVVGNADIRGVSGGQKRRVKMLEMAVGTDVTVMFLDEITNGLDAASALSICKVIRVALEAQDFSAITCLLQPSDDVYKTFHRLILLTPDGQVAYSGKTEDALGHFEGLGLKRPDEMNIPEFLLRCASSPADLWDSTESGNLPKALSSSSDLAEEFMNSPAGEAITRELDDNGDERATEDAFANDGNTPALKDFAQPTSRQIQLLVGRGWKLVRRNPASLMRAVSAIIFGVFIGTLFLNTPNDVPGTQVRGGYVLTLIFLSFLNSCMAPLDDLYADRLTFYIHRKASFYRTVSYYISQMLCSWPVAVCEAFLLCVLSFFAVGMSNTGGWGFFYFWLLFSTLTLCGTAVSRVLAYSLPTIDMAQSLGPAALLLFILSACYSPQYLELPSWLRWLAWISPCAYCYEGVIVVETGWRSVGHMDGQVFAQVFLGIPRVAFPAAPSTLSTPGGVIAFDAYMLVFLTIVFEIIGCILLHQSQKWYGPTTKRYQVASGQSLRAPPWKGVNKKSSDAEACSAVYLNDNPDVESGVPSSPPAHLTAKNIVYEVDIDPPAGAKEDSNEAEALLESTDDDTNDDSPMGSPYTARGYGQTGNGALAEFVLKRQLGDSAVRSDSTRSSAKRSITYSLTQQTELEAPEPGRLRLLSGITASFEPGTLNALMGESGAGKTTLLDAIAGYKTDGHLFGDIQVNGLPKKDEIWRSIAGYCEQVDLHNPSMTVRESLIFAARTRLRPFSMADEKKVAFATKIMRLLDLDVEFADMLVGDEASGEGLPKHARKRLTVGVELAANPSILFADEPTSGLDSLSAAMVVSSLKKAAKVQGLTVVCTIHQPSREVFLAFDNLLLLKKGGRCVYNGSIASLNEYLSASGDNYAIGKEVNPADHALDVFCGPLGVGTDWVDLYNSSSMCKTILDTVESPSREAGEISIDSTPQSFSSELFLVLQRQVVAHWRTTTYMALRFWWTILSCVLVGLVYFGSGTDGKVPQTVGAMFFFVNSATVPLLSAMVPLITERSVFYRETLSGTYSRMAYGAAVQLAEIPFNLGFALISFVIFYFMVGLTMEGERMIYFILMSLACYWVLPAIGQLLAFISPNIGAAVGVGSLLMTLFTLTMGFLLIPKDIPPWYIWLYWINPMRYMLQGFVVSEIGGKDPSVDRYLDSNFSWSYDDRWWYCYVVTLMFGAASFVSIMFATKISRMKR